MSSPVTISAQTCRWGWALTLLIRENWPVTRPAIWLLNLSTTGLKMEEEWMGKADRALCFHPAILAVTPALLSQEAMKSIPVQCVSIRAVYNFMLMNWFKLKSNVLLLQVFLMRAVGMWGTQTEDCALWRDHQWSVSVLTHIPVISQLMKRSGITSLEWTRRIWVWMRGLLVEFSFSGL